MILVASKQQLDMNMDGNMTSIHRKIWKHSKWRSVERKEKSFVIKTIEKLTKTKV